MTQPYDTIRQAISERLEELGWSQAELGRRVGVHPVVLNRFLRGSRATLAPDPLSRVLDVLGLEIRAEKISEKAP